MKYIDSTLALALVAAATPALAYPTVCCDSLSHNVKSIYHSTSSPDYRNLIDQRWSNTSILPASCVITPRSATDLSKAMKILTKNQCQFAVKSGGHNPNPGFNSISGGVSIDLIHLNTAKLAKDRSYVTLGSGLTWGEAYNIFNNSNIGFTGGACEHVGVGGLAVNGGQSFFQAGRGWVIDNILDYEVVLASGEIVHANATCHPDLYKALKGGNTNFGIVTKVNIAAFEFPGLWGGAVVSALAGPNINRPKMLDYVAEATVDFTGNNSKDLDTAMQVMNVYYSGGKGQAMYLSLANTAGVPSPKAAEGFLNMPNIIEKKVGLTKLANLVAAQSTLQPDGYREVTASITITNDYKTLREIWDATDAVYNNLPQKDKIDWLISFIPQPQVQQIHASASGGNVLGLSNVKNDQIIVWLTSRWTDAKLDGMMNKAQKDFVIVSTNVAKKHGKFSPFNYLNYAGYFQDPICGYGAENVAYLRKVAKKYDPKGVFQKLMPGGFKLSKANC